MRSLDSPHIMESTPATRGTCDRFELIRDSGGHVVCAYNAATRQVRVTRRNGKIATATLPIADQLGDRVDQAEQKPSH